MATELSLFTPIHTHLSQYRIQMYEAKAANDGVKKNPSWDSIFLMKYTLILYRPNTLTSSISSLRSIDETVNNFDGIFCISIIAIKQ